jgi:hypothetical protein
MHLLIKKARSSHSLRTCDRLSGLLRCIAPYGRNLLLLVLLSVVALPLAQAAELESSDGVNGDLFGASVSLSGSLGLVGGYGANPSGGNSGAGYVFQNVNTGTGTVTENATLIASDGNTSDSLGLSVSLDGTVGLLGAYSDDVGPNSNQGSAYVFRSLHVASGTKTQDAKLIASDGAANDLFGTSVSISGTTGVVGATGGTGQAYVFRGLDTVTGTVTQQAKLTASDAAAGDAFGQSVSIAGTLGLVGASADDDGGSSAGSAYVFRNLDTITGTMTQNTKLTASDAAANSSFGFSSSLSGSDGLVGAYGVGAVGGGQAYLFRGLDVAGVTEEEDAILRASDAVYNDRFGFAVALDGSVGLVGARYNDEKGAEAGAAYFFNNLDTASGTVNEQLKVFASDAAAGADFGYAVSLEGDLFLIGAQKAAGVVAGTGKAYSGSYSSITTLDVGSTSREIDGISFRSRTDWIVGDTTDSNQVALTAGDAAVVTVGGMAVYIGKSGGSDSNTLSVAGSLTSNEVYIGSIAGNTGNTLNLESTATFASSAFRLAEGNFLSIEGDYTDINTLLTYLDTTTLQIWDGSLWETIDNLNYASLISQDFSAGYTTIATIPEPGVLSLIAAAGLGLLGFGTRKSALRLR